MDPSSHLHFFHAFVIMVSMIDDITIISSQKVHAYDDLSYRMYQRATANGQCDQLFVSFVS